MQSVRRNSVGRFPRNDKEAEAFIRAKYTASVSLSKSKYMDYEGTRRTRLSFFREFSTMRLQGIAGIGAYKAGLDLMGRLGMSARAQLLLDVALEDHVTPTVSMYMKVMQGYASVGNVAGVTYILKKTWQLSGNDLEVAGKFMRYVIMALHRKGDRINTFRVAAMTWQLHKGHPAIYTRLLSACVSFEQGGMIFTEMLDKEMNVSIADWGSLIDSCCLHGDVKSATYVAETMVKEFGTVPTVVHFCQFFQSLICCGDLKGFAQLDKIAYDKNISDSILTSLRHRFLEISRRPPPDVMTRVGSLRMVELLVGIHSVRGDFAKALESFETRGLLIGTTKTWGPVLIRLVAAAIHRITMLTGYSASNLMENCHKPLLAEMRGPAEGVLYAMIDCCYKNKGFGCVRLWRLFKPYANRPTSKILKINPIPLYHLAHCVSLRIAVLHEADPTSPRVTVLLATIEDIYKTIYTNSPWTASLFLSPLLMVYGTLSLLDKAVAMYKMHLLAGHPPHLLEHAALFREIFRLRGDSISISHIDGLPDVMRRAEELVQTYLK